MGLLRNFALTIPSLRRLHEDRDAHAARADQLQAGLDEARAHLAHAGSPFFHYNSILDGVALMSRHEAHDRKADPEHLTNFLGVKTHPKFFPGILDGRGGEVEALPVPANWHTDIAEWTAALRAVELAKGDFTVMELGCGWGCWINNTGVAARRAGLKPHLIGVDGDEGHVAFANEACATNGFSPDEVEIHHAIAGARSGTALFPKQSLSGDSYGLEAIFDATPEQVETARAGGAYDELPVISLDEITAGHPRVDLLHIDIQGAEADLIDGCVDFLKRKVAYILIGTHSREIEGRLFTTLRREGFWLEVERPAIIRINDQGQPWVYIDGVQGWRNPSLTSV